MPTGGSRCDWPSWDGFCGRASARDSCFQANCLNEVSERCGCTGVGGGERAPGSCFVDEEIKTQQTGDLLGGAQAVNPEGCGRAPDTRFPDGHIHPFCSRAKASLLCGLGQVTQHL